MSVRIDDAIDLLCLIRDGHEASPSEPLRSIRIAALEQVAKARGVTRQDIADVYIRRLSPSVRGTREFDRIVAEWLRGQPRELKAALEKNSLDKADTGRIKAFFEADTSRTQQITSASG